MRTVTEIKSPRVLRLLAAKQKSESDKRTVRVAFEQEHFVYENGALIEYEYYLPDYMEE